MIEFVVGHSANKIFFTIAQNYLKFISPVVGGQIIAEKKKKNFNVGLHYRVLMLTFTLAYLTLSTNSGCTISSITFTHWSTRPATTRGTPDTQTRATSDMSIVSTLCSDSH